MKTNNISYRRVRDYNIPNLIIPPEEANITLSKWGMLHKDYLLKHMLPEEREQFLRKYLISERFEPHIDLFCDFRHNGDRVFSDIICDRYSENKLHNLTSLHFENDSDEMTAMVLAYRNKSKTYDYKKAVTDECRKLLSKNRQIK